MALNLVKEYSMFTTQNMPRFFVAIDVNTKSEALRAAQLIARVSGNFGVKFNLDLILKDPSVLSDFDRKYSWPIFADIKMWNGRRTITEVFKQLADLGVEMVNVWSAADTMLDRSVQIAKDNGLIVLGLTVLTHYDESHCQKFHKMSMSEIVRLYAKTALERGCNGYILPGTMLDAVSDLPGIKFNPAVRPGWYRDQSINYQEQIMTPAKAVQNGADIVSCGSPVFKNADLTPAKAVSKILKEIRKVQNT